MKIQLALLSLAFASVSVAQEAAPTTPPILNEKKPADTTRALSLPLPPAPRYTSIETAAHIGETLPKFSTEKPHSATKTAELPDLRDIDKPRNTIIRLPKKIVEERLMPRMATPAPDEAPSDVFQLSPYIVREEKIPDFKERELLTPTGKLQLAYKRHPGLRFNLPFLSNDGIAMAMLQEEFRLERISEMSDLGGLYTDAKRAQDTKQLTNQTFLRSLFGKH